MWIASVYYRVPQDDKYGLSPALLSNLSEIAPVAFGRAHRSQRCLWKVFTRKEYPTSGLR